MTEPSSLLAGLRILAVEQFGAGPYGTSLLADLGAEIIKIEDPRLGGDIGRYVPPVQVGRDSLFFETFNRGKRSIALDLTAVDEREVFERLVASADAVFSNLRGDLPARLGLTYAALERANPAIVCVALTGYGRDDHRASWPGYDALVQAEAGWAALTGKPGDPPTKSGLSLADYAAGTTAIVGLLAGVIGARATGRGGDIDVSLYDTALAMLTYPATWLLSAGIEARRMPMSAHPSIVPFQFFATYDGHVAIACAKQHFFEALMRELGLAEAIEDSRFADFAARMAHREALVAMISAVLGSGRTEEWCARLRGKVPIAPVRSLAEAADPEALAIRGLLREYDHPTLGRVRTIGSPIRAAGPRPERARAPRFDEDGAELQRQVATTDELLSIRSTRPRTDQR